MSGRGPSRAWRRISWVTTGLIVAWVAGWTMSAPDGSTMLESSIAPLARSAGVVSAAAVRPATVLGLGDSVTAGTACGCLDFVRGYARLVTARSGHTMVADNDGMPGQTSQGLLEDLTSDPGLRDDVRRADVILITIGANDLGPALNAWRQGSCDVRCATTDLPSVQSNIARSVGRIQAIRGGTRTRVVVTTYWNVFVDGHVAMKAYGSEYLAWSDEVTRAANAAICAAATRSGATCVDLYAPFKGDGGSDPTRFLAGDGDHPDAAGHRLIAETLADQVPVSS